MWESSKMSFRGKVVRREKIDTPLGPGELVTTEYPNPKRKKTIWWLGGLQAIHLGELITHYIAERRESDFEEIKWKPLFYSVKLNEDADASEIVDVFVKVEIEEDNTYSFDELEDAEEFIEGVKCKTVEYGTICVGSRAEFERWVKVMEKVKEEEK